MKDLASSRRIIAIVAAILISTMTVLAQTVGKHVVDRGETLTTIAEKYGVTKEDIISLNPDAAQFVYVGMELKIPEGVSTKETTVSNNIRTDVNSKYQYNNTTVSYTGNDFERWSIVFEIGYGFLQKPEGLKGDTPFAYFATIGANYNITTNLYAGIRAGYNSSTTIGYYSVDRTNVTTETQFHLLQFPIEVGYKWNAIEDKVAFIPFAGTDINVGLSGKYKTKVGTNAPENTDIKIGGKVGLGLRAGLRVNLWGFVITGSYVLPLNKKQEGFFGEDAYPEISIGWGF